MAVVWAKSNGNWTDTTLWAFWNETTQQIEDYGQVPQVDDVLYLDGHNVSLGNEANITVSKISTNTNPFTTLGSGQLTVTGGNIITINANIDIYFNTNGFFSITSGTATIMLNGNIQQFDSTGGIFFGSAYVACKAIINGNLLIDSGVLRRKTDLTSTGFNITINGNFVSNSTSLLIQTPYGNQFLQSAYLFNGNVTLNSALMDDDTNTPNYVISGWLNVFAYQNKRGFSVNKIKYSGKFPLILYYLDCDETFECIQLDDPNPNPYIIVNSNTIAQTYPTEDKVLAPTQYGAQMELVGQYTPDYPPESVVLKDYVYDGGEMVGTLENEVTVTNTNTINVYPYKKRQ